MGTDTDASQTERPQLLNSVRATHSLQLSVLLRNPNDFFSLLLSGPGRLSYSTKDELSTWARICHDECLETRVIFSTSEGILQRDTLEELSMKRGSQSGGERIIC